MKCSILVPPGGGGGESRCKNCAIDWENTTEQEGNDTWVPICHMPCLAIYHSSKFCNPKSWVWKACLSECLTMYIYQPCISSFSNRVLGPTLCQALWWVMEVQRSTSCPQRMPASSVNLRHPPRTLALLFPGYPLWIIFSPIPLRRGASPSLSGFLVPLKTRYRGPLFSS